LESNSNSKQKTFRPIKGHGDDKRKELSSRAYATLGNKSVKEAVKLPEGEDPNEWLAVNSKTTFQS
jgi:MOB kinase activator 1